MVATEPTEPPWPRLRVLVLGGAGLIGTHVVRALIRRQAKVRVATRDDGPRVSLRGLPVERVVARLEDPAELRAAMAGCDLLVHAAAPYSRSHFHGSAQVAAALSPLRALLALVRAETPPELLDLPRSMREQIEVEQSMGAMRTLDQQPEREFEVRHAVRSPERLEDAVQGRLNTSLHAPLAAIADLPGLKRTVYVSSITTLGRPHGWPPPPGVRRDRALATEEDRFDLIHERSPYFRVKAALESEVTRAAVEGLPVTIVNPTFCIDAFDSAPTSGRLLIPVARGRMPFWLSGQVNAVAARDVGEGVAGALAHGRTGRRYVLGGENLSARDLMQRVAECAGVRPPSHWVPGALAEGVAWLTEVLNLAIGHRWPALPLSAVRMLKHGQHVETERARAELGFTQTPIETAIRDALAFYRETGLL